MMRRLLVVVLLSLPSFPAGAFEVTKNVNTGGPPVEKVVLFDRKETATDGVTLFDEEGGRLTRGPDGALEGRITGNGAVKFGITWKPSPALGPTFSTRDFGHLVITCRLEGTNRTAGSNAAGQRPDNLWFVATLFNARGEPVGSANLADGTEDGKTPATTTTVILPLLIFTYFGEHDTSAVAAVGFTWPKARANVERDFRLIVERIALTE